MKRISILSVAATVAALALIPSTQAQAGIHFEPGVGWHFLNSEDSSGTKSSGNGFGADLRLGYNFSHLAIGAAGGMSFVTFKNAAAGQPANQWMTLGAFAQFAFPAFPINLRGQYDFISDSGVTVAGVKGGRKGNNLRFGLGYRIIPKLALNVDYIITTFTDAYAAGVTTAIPTGTRDKSDTSIFVSLSVPLGM